MQSIVVADLGRSGIANKLLIWSKAYLFAKQNDLSLYVKNLVHIPFGPYIRRENSKRWYWKSVKQPHSILFELLVPLFKITHQTVVEPIQVSKSSKPIMYVFNKVPHWSDYFIHIREFRGIIIPAFYQLVADRQIQKLQSTPSPVIGVHIRRGDFGKLATPIESFILTVEKIREIAGYIVPVTIFSDGSYTELEPILSLQNVSYFKSNSDLFDLLLLSKSKVIITSKGSTYGYWAGYVSDGIIIRQENDTKNGQIKPLSLSDYEGRLFGGEDNKILIKNLFSLLNPTLLS